MTRKHYEQLAAIVRAQVSYARDSGQLFYVENARQLACALADMCETNPRFQRKRFLIACGVPSNKNREGDTC